MPVFSSKMTLFGKAGLYTLIGMVSLFILRQAANRFWIALSVLGFEGGQLGQCLLLGRLLPDANEFGLHVATLSSGDGIEDVALFMHQTALTRRGRKQLRDPPPAARRAHRSRSGRSGWPLVSADLAGG